MYVVWVNEINLNQLICARVLKERVQDAHLKWLFDQYCGKPRKGTLRHLVAPCGTKLEHSLNGNCATAHAQIKTLKIQQKETNNNYCTHARTHTYNRTHIQLLPYLPSSRAMASPMASRHVIAAAALAVLFAAVLLWFWFSASGRASNKLAPSIVQTPRGDQLVVFSARQSSDTLNGDILDGDTIDGELQKHTQARVRRRTQGRTQARTQGRGDLQGRSQERSHGRGDSLNRYQWPQIQERRGKAYKQTLATASKTAMRLQLARLQLVPPPRTQSAMLFRVPISFTNGVPMMSVGIEGQSSRFVCVADTGSHHLNVNADTCKSCDGTYGSFVTTPELHAQPTVWLRYGTQHDAAKIARNAGVRLHAGGPPAYADVHVTVDRVMAASNYNVIGLLRRTSPASYSYSHLSYSPYSASSSSSSSSSSPSPHAEAVASEASQASEASVHQEFQQEFLAQILPRTSALYIRLYGGNIKRLRNRGFVAGVRDSAVDLLRRNATVRTTLLPSLATVHSYIVALTAVRVGGRAVEGAPKFLLIDTGSNMTSFSRDAFVNMLPALQRGATLTLEIDRQPVDIPASTYMHHEEEEQEEEQEEEEQEEEQEEEYYSDEDVHNKNSATARNGGLQLFHAGSHAPRTRLMIDDDLRILDDSPMYAIWGAHAMRGLSLVFTGDNELLLTPAVPHPDTGLVADDAVLV